MRLVIVSLHTAALLMVLSSANAAQAADRIFWAQRTVGADAIARANPDGSNPTTVANWPTVSNVAALSVDSKGGRVYWISAVTGDDAILSADLDGQNAATLIAWPAVLDPVAIAVDSNAGLIFWAESASGNDRIRRANLDGTGVATIVSWPDVANPVAISFDPISDRLYFAENGFGSERIVRVDTNGNGATTIVSWPEITDPVAISVDGSAGRVYWIEASFADDALRSISILGGAVTTILSWPVIADPTALVVDESDGFVYWTESTVAEARIARATTVGANVTTILASPLVVNPVAIDLETFDRCLSDLNCDDLNACTIDVCDVITGLCTNDPIVCPPGSTCVGGICTAGCSVDADCNDSVACTTDVCFEGACQNIPDNSACETGLFCDAKRCDPIGGCVSISACVPQPGNPCVDPNACDESSDSCGGCFAPSVTGSGPRYLTVTPNDQGSTAVALLVTGVCDDPAISCASKYVQSNCLGGQRDGLSCASDADCPKTCATPPNAGQPCFSNSDCGGGACEGFCDVGSLGDVPVFLTAAQWTTVPVRGNAIRPDTTYNVYSVCDFGGTQVQSAAATATTRTWADTNGDGFVNVLDITTTVDAVKLLFSPFVTVEGTNVWPCDPGSRIDVLDVTSTVDAVKGLPLPCAPVCP